MARILVVDDEDILRMLICDTLEDLGHEITEAEDGEEALAKLAEEKYDLLILDYMMPNVTGLEVIEQMDPEIKTALNILMLTAKAQEADKANAFKTGADYFMPKPFSPAKLEEVVENILAGKVNE